MGVLEAEAKLGGGARQAHLLRGRGEGEGEGEGVGEGEGEGEGEAEVEGEGEGEGEVEVEVEGEGECEGEGEGEVERERERRGAEFRKGKQLAGSPASHVAPRRNGAAPIRVRVRVRVRLTGIARSSPTHWYCVSFLARSRALTTSVMSRLWSPPPPPPPPTAVKRFASASPSDTASSAGAVADAMPALCTSTGLAVNEAPPSAAVNGAGAAPPPERTAGVPRAAERSAALLGEGGGAR